MWIMRHCRRRLAPCNRMSRTGKRSGGTFFRRMGHSPSQEHLMPPGHGREPVAASWLARHQQVQRPRCPATRGLPLFWPAQADAALSGPWSRSDLPAAERSRIIEPIQAGRALHEPVICRSGTPNSTLIDMRISMAAAGNLAGCALPPGSGNLPPPGQAIPSESQGASGAEESRTSSVFGKAGQV